MAIDFDGYTGTNMASDFGSVLAGVLAHPAAKGVCAFGLWCCTALGLPVDIAVLMAAMFLLDFVLGVAVALKRRRFTCRRFLRGTAKIPVYTMLLLISWGAQRVMQEVFGQTFAVPVWTAAYLTMHDAISIVGKSVLLGLPVPPMFRKAAIRIGKAVDAGVDRALDKIESDAEDGAFRKF